jgi:hypothetical protein
VNVGDAIDAHELTVELARAEQALKDLNASASVAYRERDEAVDQRDAARATLALWKRTADTLPAIGVMCDADFCTAAIGVVGIKLVDVDVVRAATLEIAAHAGWWLPTDGRTFCPRCRHDHQQGDDDAST